MKHCTHPQPKKSYAESPYTYCPDCFAVKTDREGKWHVCNLCRRPDK